MTIRFLITLGSVLFLSASATGQDQKSVLAQKTELGSIGSYTKSIDQFTRRNPKQRRLFGNAAGTEEKQDEWREFKSAKQMAGENLDESAFVWLKQGKVVTARFSFTSASGDWYHFVTYYFRADGTLAKIHAQLNTFAAAGGGLSVVRNKFYHAGGRSLRTSTRYLDLESQKPRKRGEFMDEPIPLYKTVRELPFSKLLRS
ncbi:MAG TPA: hypothetical protein VN920_09820 [Pyrinomonadaceae bacterium]|nr:hypothetical protein [Pyrinomonadaceae bacterium]